MRGARWSRAKRNHPGTHTQGAGCDSPQTQRARGTRRQQSQRDPGLRPAGSCAGWLIARRNRQGEGRTGARAHGRTGAVPSRGRTPSWRGTRIGCLPRGLTTDYWCDIPPPRRRPPPAARLRRCRCMPPGRVEAASGRSPCLRMDWRTAPSLVSLAPSTSGGTEPATDRVPGAQGREVSTTERVRLVAHPQAPRGTLCVCSCRWIVLACLARPADKLGSNTLASGPRLRPVPARRSRDRRGGRVGSRTQPCCKHIRGNCSAPPCSMLSRLFGARPTSDTRHPVGTVQYAMRKPSARRPEAQAEPIEPRPRHHEQLLVPVRPHRGPSFQQPTAPRHACPGSDPRCRADTGGTGTRGEDPNNSRHRTILGG